MFGAFLLLAPALASSAAEIDFAHEVVPVLKRHCAECHADTEAKGGFSINTRDLLMDNGNAVPGSAAESYFLELVVEEDPEFRMPPEKHEPVPPAEIALLKRWVEAGMPWEPGFTFAVSAYEPPLAPRRPVPPSAIDGREHPVDRFIDRYLEERGLPRPEGIDDLAFLRRVHLDLVGLLPDAAEAEAFLSDEGGDRRQRKIEELLARDLSYADHWLSFWNDLLRNDYTGTGFITGGRKQVSRWLYDQLKRNAPFDEMVRGLVAPADDESSGFIDGIEWRGEVSAGQTLPMQFSQSLSQSFLGINMKCASCHDSFTDRWTLADAYGLAAIYAEDALEIHRCDLPQDRVAETAWPFPELGQIDSGAPREERLAQLASLMIHEENGRVPRTLVNRLWGQLMGRGLVHPLDAMQTEPWHGDLLDFLASDFQDNGYDLRRTLGLIATSEAYASARPRESIDPSLEDGGAYVYRGPLAKRLTAEQFVDALWQLSGTAPERFDAPVARGISSAEAGTATDTLPEGASPLWQAESAETGAASGKDGVLLRFEFEIDRPVQSAGLVAASAAEFALYVNQRPALSRAETPGGVTNTADAPVGGHLRQGTNRILATARVERKQGAESLPPGLFAAIQVQYSDGSAETFATGGSEGWRLSRRVPAGAQPARWDLDALPWEEPAVAPFPDPSSEPEARLARALAEASVGTSLMARASLMASDFLMRSLGRPNRDQIVTTRPDELSTLEAIDLSNNEILAAALAKAGADLAEEAASGDRESLVDRLFLSTLTRHPSGPERELVLEALAEPDPETGADLLWSLMMSPEFLYAR